LILQEESECAEEIEGGGDVDEEEDEDDEDELAKIGLDIDFGK